MIICSFTDNYELRDTLAEFLSPIWILTDTYMGFRDRWGRGCFDHLCKWGWMWMRMHDLVILSFSVPICKEDVSPTSWIAVRIIQTTLFNV